jgi:hypothetical protein
MPRRSNNIQFWKPRIHKGVAKRMSSTQIFCALNELANTEAKISLAVIFSLNFSVLI